MEPDHSVELMSKTLALKRQMKEYMVSKAMVYTFVPNTVKLLFPEAKTTEALTENFLGLAHADGVHLTDDAYVSLGSVLLKVVAERLVVKDVLSGKNSTGKSFYWRGFTSPVGSARPKASTHSYKDSHPGGGKWRDPPNRFYSNRSSARGRGKLYGPASGGKYWN